MIPAGYLFKRLAPPPDYLSGAGVVSVCSVCDCVVDPPVDLHESWRQNAFGVATSEELLRSLAAEQGRDLSGAVLFYYEAFEQEQESDGWSFDPKEWCDLTPMPTGYPADAPQPPAASALLGYDVLICEDTIEHSPLACQSVAREVAVNVHCLFDRLEDAKAAIDNDKFVGCKMGVYRIFSVHWVLQPRQEA